MMRNSKPVFIRGRNKSSAIFLASILALLVGLATRAADGRAQVQGLATGRTWVVVQRAAAADSVEVIVQ